MDESIKKRCTVCGYTRKHHKVIIAGMVFWQCDVCKADSPYKLRGQMNLNPTKWRCYGIVVALLLLLCACNKKEDAPKASTPHIAGSWTGTGADDAIGAYNVSMDLTQSGESAAGTFTMTSAVATIHGNASLLIGPQGGDNLQTLTLTRADWTVADPANANRLCSGAMTIRAGSTAMTSRAVVFQYTMTDCQGGTWIGGANLTKQMGTN